MSLIKNELTEKSGFKMEFSVSKDAYAKAEMAAYKKAVKNLNVPGFRKGKAPKHIIERMYGKGIFFEDAINDCLPEAFEEAVKEAGITVVGAPKFDLVSDEDGIVLSAEGFVKPDVTVEGYKGIVAKKKAVRVTAKEIDEELANVQKRNARKIDVTDRPVAQGDIANIDYEGFVDGVAFAGGKGEGHDLKIGSGSFIPGFEDQIVGKSIGESFDVVVTFPAEYHAKELAGKEATFKTTVNGIKFEELPVLDDEFAKDVSEFDTLDEYKADLKGKISERKNREAESEFDSLVCEELIGKLVAEIPEVMFENEADNYVRDYENRLRMQGLDLNTYLKYTGQTVEQLRAEMRPQAEKQVKLRLALEKIAAVENLTVTDEEIEAEYTRISEAYKMPVEQVKGMVNAGDIRQDMLVGAAMKLVKDNVVSK